MTRQMVTVARMLAVVAAVATLVACGDSGMSLDAGRDRAAPPDHDASRDVGRPGIHDVRPDGRQPDAGQDGVRRGLVVVTLNTHSFQEGADSLSKLQAIGHGLALLNADLVGLCEVMSGTFWSYDYAGAQYDGTAIIQSSLEAASGSRWHSAVQGFAHWDTGEEMANVILSRTPLTDVASQSLTTTDFWPAPGEKRSVLGARTEVPGVGAVHVSVTHPWGWTSADTGAQIGEVKSFMAQQVRGDEVVRLLVGDLNLPSTWPAYQTWLDPPVALVDTYAVANPGGFADATTFDGQHRIDYILVERSLAQSAGWEYRSLLTFDGQDHNGLTLPRVSDHKAVVTELLGQ